MTKCNTLPLIIFFQSIIQYIPVNSPNPTKEVVTCPQLKWYYVCTKGHEKIITLITCPQMTKCATTLIMPGQIDSQFIVTARMGF